MTESSRTILAVLAAILVALAGGRLLLRTRSGQKPGYFRFASAFYLSLGLAAGSQGFSLLSDSLLQNLEPVKELALGWIGLLFGLQLNWKKLERVPPLFFRTLLFESMASMTLAGVSLWFLAKRFGWPGGQAETLIAVALLSALAGVSSPTATALAASAGGRARPRLAHLAHFVSSLDPLLPLVLFALAAGYTHATGGGTLAALIWLAASLLTGLIMGLLFYSFARHRHNERELTMMIIAFAVFSGGLASCLGLSSLFTAAVTGAVLTNLVPAAERVFRALAAREKPILVLLLVLTGADWRIGEAAGPETVACLLIVYLAARIAAKTITMALSTGKGSAGFEPGAWRGGLALLGEGGMSVAILANCQILFKPELSATVVTVGLLAVICMELVSARAARSALFTGNEPEGK